MTVPAFQWRLARRTIMLGLRPVVMGILNITPDSFSDGGRFGSVQDAVDRALLMEDEGAGIIDIGGESTRPFAPSVSEADELERVVPIIEKLAGRLDAPISVDTYKSSVARAALAAGAEIVNDISAMTFDPDMASVVSQAVAGVVLMHTRGRPGEMQLDTRYTDIIQEISGCFRDMLQRADAAGISRSCIVLDPGICFGKDVTGNLGILRNLGDLTSVGQPLLVGSSRKSFIGAVLDRSVDERTFGTAATVAAAVMNGAAIVRVHDVRQMKDVALMAQAIRDGFTPSQAG